MVLLLSGCKVLAWQNMGQVEDPVAGRDVVGVELMQLTDLAAPASGV